MTSQSDMIGRKGEKEQGSILPFSLSPFLPCEIL